MGTLFVLLFSLAVGNASAFDGFIRMTNGYFYDSATGEPWIPRGIAYQTWNRPLGIWQTYEQIDYDLDEMKKMGANSIRVDFVWQHLEEAGDNQWSWTNYEYLVQAAEARGLRIFALVGYQWPPNWFPNEWYTMHPPAYDSGGIYHPTRWQSDIINYEHPAARAQYAEWFENVCGHFKDSKAIVGWIVGNEYGYLGLWSKIYDGYDPECEQAFRTWCAAKYTAISNLNTAWGSSYTNFSQIVLSDGYAWTGPQGALWADMVQWHEDSIASFTAVGAVAARAADTNHLLSYSTVGMQWGEEDWRYHAEDRGKITRACASNNAPLGFFSINNYPWAMDGSETRNGQWGISFTKKTAGIPVVYSETGFTSSETLFPGMSIFRQGGLIRNALWESLEAGAIGTHIFAWHDRQYITDREKGFGILYADRVIKPAFWTCRDTFTLMSQVDIGRHLMGSQDPKPDIAFLWDDATDSQYVRFENEMQHEAGAMERLGYEPNFLIGVDELASGAYTNYKAIILPRNMRVSDTIPGYTNSVLNFLLTQVIPKGIHVIAFADLPGMQDRWGKPRAAFSNEVSQLFGIDPSDTSAFQPAGSMVDSIYYDYYRKINVRYNTNAAGRLTNYVHSPSVWKYNDEIAVTNGGVLWAEMDTRNKGFEASSTNLPGWSGKWGNAFITNWFPLALDGGTNMLGMSGDAGIWKDFPVAPLGRYTASTWLRSNNDDPLRGGANATISIEWMDKSGTNLGTNVSARLMGSTSNTWTRYQVDATAPSNAYVGRWLIRCGTMSNAPNLVGNGELSGTNEAPDGWGSWNNGNHMPDTGTYRSSSNSWAFWWDGGLAREITPNFRPGDSIVFSGYLRTPSWNPLSNKYGIIQVEYLSNSTVLATASAYPTINSNSATDTWILSQGTSTVPANVDAIRIVVRCNDPGAGWFFADDISVSNTSPGGSVYVDNKQWAPAVVAKDHGTAKAAIVLYSLDNLPDSNEDTQPDTLPYKWRSDIIGGILDDYCGVQPTIETLGTNAYLCLPEYRTCTNGAILMQVKSYAYDCAATNGSGGDWQTFTFQTALVTGKTIRAFEQCRVIETNSDGVFSLALPPDGQEMILAYDPPGGTNMFVQIANAPSVVHPYGDQSYGIYVNYDTGGKTGMVLKVAFVENGDNGDGKTNEVYQLLWTNAAAGPGSSTFWLWIPDPDQSDPDYKSVPEGGSYLIKAWLEDASSNKLAETVPQTTELKWGIKPIDPVPLHISKGDTTNMPVKWEDLDEQLFWQNTPLTRNNAFPNRVAVYRSTKTEAMYSNQFDRVNAVCDWLETLGFECANPMDVAFDNVTVTAPAGTNLPVAALFSDNMEGGTNLWKATGLWHMTTDLFASPSNSWAYNNGSNYVTGARNTGELSRAVSLSNATSGVSLRFKSWYETEDTGTAWDRKYVQISTNGTAWSTLLQVSGTNKQWISHVVDLGAYAGKMVWIRFYFDTIDAMNNRYRGWFIDDVEVLALQAPKTDLFYDNMESTTNWAASGLWRQTGSRSNAVVSGTNRWVYNRSAADTNYNTGARNSGSLLSGWIALGDLPGATLTFRSWYQTENEGTSYDRKFVYLTTDGSTWVKLCQVSGPSMQWTQPSLDLSAYAGSPIRLKFTFDTIDAVNNNYEGWYVDDVRISTLSGIGSTAFSDRSEDGTNEWSASGLWHIASDLSYSPSNSWAYNNGVNYSTGARNSGSLISRWIDLSDAAGASLSFRSWYETEDAGISWDRKIIQVTTNGVDWAQVAQVSGLNKQWTAQTADLGAYAGQRIRLKFSFDTVDAMFNYYRGWYLDDIEVKLTGVNCLFTDDFSEPATNWTRVAGAANWDTDDTSLRAWRIGNDDNIVRANTATWTNYIVSANIRYNKQDHYFSDAEVYLRYQDRNNFVKVAIHNFYGFWRLKYTVRVRTNSLYSGWIYEFSKTNQPAENTWYTLKVKAETNTFRVFLNGESVGSFTDTNFPSGRIAVGTKAVQLGIWDPAQGYYFIDDDEYAYYSSVEGQTVTLGEPLDLDWGYLVRFFPMLILPSTYVMNDTEASNVAIWLTNGWFSVLATDGGVGMKDETGADDRGRLEPVFGVGTETAGVSGLSLVEIGTNVHYATLDYNPEAQVALKGSATAWKTLTQANTLGTMFGSSTSAPALICNVITQKIDSPPKAFCFNYAVDTGGQLTNESRQLAQRVFEWLQGQTYRLTLELKYVLIPGNPNLDIVVFSTNFWTLNGWGTNDLDVTIPMDNVMTGTNLYWVMYTSPWDATNAWQTHKGFFSSGNDGMFTTLGGFGLQLLGITENAFGGRDWDMWVAYNTQGSNLVAHFGVKDKGALADEDNFNDGNTNGWTVMPGTNIAWTVPAGALRATATGSGYSWITKNSLAATGQNISVEFNARWMSGATNAGDGGLLYRGVPLDISPRACGWRDASTNLYTNNLPATNVWQHVMVNVRDGVPYPKSDLLVNGKAVFLDEPIEETNWTSSSVSLLSPYYKGYVEWDNFRAADEQYSVTTQAVAGLLSPTNANFWPSLPDYDPGKWEFEGTSSGGKYEWFIYYRGEGVHGYRNGKVYFAPWLMVDSPGIPFPSNVLCEETVQVPVGWENLGSNQPCDLYLRLENPFLGTIYVTNRYSVTNTDGWAYFAYTVPSNLPVRGDYSWAAYLAPTNATNAWLQRIGSDDNFRFDSYGVAAEPEMEIWVRNDSSNRFMCYADSGIPEGSAFWYWTGVSDGDYTGITPPEGVKCCRTTITSAGGWGIFHTNGYKNLSIYTNMKFWVKAEDSSIFVEIEAPAGTKRSLYLDAMGWNGLLAGQWQELTVPISQFGFANPLTNVYGSFLASLNSLPTRYAVQMLDTNTGWIAGYGGTSGHGSSLRKTTNGASQWMALYVRTNLMTTTFTDLDFVDATNGWIVGGYEQLLATTNGGLTWEPRTNGLPRANYWYSIDFINSQTGWACGQTSIVMTTDGGLNWTSVFGASNLMRSIQFLDASNGWASGVSVMLRTTNSGTSWTYQVMPTNNYWRDVFFLNSATGWACGYTGMVCRTVDGGATWTRATNVPMTASQYLYGMAWPTPTNGWIVGTGVATNNMCFTRDGGLSWSNCNSGVPTSLVDADFANANVGYAVGMSGYIVKTVNGAAATPTWTDNLPGAREFFFDNIRWTVNP